MSYRYHDTRSPTCNVSELDSIPVTDHEGTYKTIKVYQLILHDTNVTLSSLGASILGIVVDATNIVVGYDSVASMWKDKNPFYFSVIPGRVANRICKGKLQLDIDDPQIYQLAINNPPNHLHGGNVGFSHKVWDAEIVPDGVRFTLLSPDSDQGYPSSVIITAEYTLHATPKSNIVRLCLSMRARLLEGSSSPVNLTQHCYFNLAGKRSKDGILSHTLRMNADAYTPVDETSIPTRSVQSLNDDQIMDFRSTRTMRDALMEYGMKKCNKTKAEVEQDLNDRRTKLDIPYGFDHNYVVTPSEDPDTLKYVACLQWKDRRLTVCSTAPGVQLYTGNYLDGGIANRWQGICLETQHFPDSVIVDPNKHPEFYKGKCPVLTKENPVYSQYIEYVIEYKGDGSLSADSTDGFCGTTLDGKQVYSSVEEMWADQAVSNDDSKSWYHRAATYYNESCPPTIDGVLGGFVYISEADLEGSIRFVHELVHIRPEVRTWLVRSGSGSHRACECGAGLGRVTKGVLLSNFLPGITHCDLVEPSESLLFVALDYLGDSIASKCRFFCQGLQDWEPAENTYSVMWIQWVLSYLTDHDIVKFLKRCVVALCPGGLIVLKENTCEASDFELDINDASVTRSPRYWRHLIQAAGLRVVYERAQHDIPGELYPVPIMALEPGET